MRLRYLLTLLLLVAATSTAKPRLAVNIVVSGLGANDIDRYKDNFGTDGFNRLLKESLNFTECYADYAPTTAEAGITTFATGTTPSTHGIFSSICFDRNHNKSYKLFHKELPPQDGLLRKEVEQCYSTDCISTQTLAEAAIASKQNNKAITIAHKAISAITLAGRKGEVYWIGDNGSWTTADCYAEELPSWVRTYNSDEMNRVFATGTWYGRYTREKYRNTRTSTITLYEAGKSKRPGNKKSSSSMSWVSDLRSMPSGNIALFEFAKRAISSLLPMHIDDECKILNICLDNPRYIAERYGADSIEYEDMLYSLDASLAEFLTFLYAQVSSPKELLITLTSDSGVSPTTTDNSDAERFNSRQFEVIMNAFLSARYGQDAWILGYSDGSLYLNHDVVYRHKKSLSEVQNEVATFALQFHGVANALTATAMQNTQFSRGAMFLAQNGFNARTSGDVLIILEPERISQDGNRIAMSGSIYNYDRHIPLLISGGEITPRVIHRRITNEQIAPTIAKFIGVSRPLCSDSEIIDIK